MKVAWSIVIGLVLLQGSAFSQSEAQPPSQPPAPEIQVVDGKVSMSALAVPLSRIVSMLDRAMGLKSKVPPEVASSPISVRFKDLALKDAVQKIFEGQPLNYSLIEGKGIDVSGRAVGGATTTTASSFDSAPPIQSTPLPTASPIQPAVPINAGQPVPIGTPSANAANPANPVNANPAPATNTAPSGAATPGQLPPAIGGANPMTQPVGAPAVGTAAPAVGFPMSTPPPPQPSGPGTVGGASPSTPGTITTPGTIPR